MLRVRVSNRPLRALVFDIENRPLSYWYDRPTAEVTVIATKWYGKSKTTVLMQTRDSGLAEVLPRFRALYDEAEVVIGHNIRSHDLPILHGAFVENGLEGLNEKMTVDTLKDMTRYKDIPKSLEYLADMLGAPYEKFNMSQHSWRVANRLEDKGLALARKRASVDVLVTEWVYDEQRRRGLITKSPRVWKP